MTNKAPKTNAANELFERITHELISAIESGTGKWEMPWTQLGAHLAPRNIDGRLYRGFNVWVLAATASLKGWNSNTWGTYKAWQRHGAQVRKGEKGTQVVLWKRAKKRTENETGDTEESSYLYARVFTVFAAEQVDGYEAPAPVKLPTHERIEAAEAYFAKVGATVHEGGDSAFYRPVTDEIQVPTIDQFRTPEHFYSTLAHEHIHWTGHKSRLDRDLHNRFGSEAYAMEELVAELGAAMWSAQTGVDQTTRDDHASYLGGWLKVLKEDSRALVSVMSKAQAAIDHLNGLVGLMDEATDLDEVA